MNWDEFWMLVQMKMGDQMGDPRANWGRDEWLVYFNSIGGEGYGWISDGEFKTAYMAENPGASMDEM